MHTHSLCTQCCHKLQTEVMRSIAVGLGLASDYFDTFCAGRDHNLRLLRYPSIEKTAEDEKRTRGGEHHDYGMITMVFQDMIGGLEVQDKEGKFVPATPIPGR